VAVSVGVDVAVIVGVNVGMDVAVNVSVDSGGIEVVGAGADVEVGVEEGDEGGVIAWGIERPIPVQVLTLYVETPGHRSLSGH